MHASHSTARELLSWRAVAVNFPASSRSLLASCTLSTGDDVGMGGHEGLRFCTDDHSTARELNSWRAVAVTFPASSRSLLVSCTLSTAADVVGMGGYEGPRFCANEWR